MRTLAFLFSIGLVAVTSTFAAESPRSASFDKDWKFSLGDPENASKTDFDDSKWRTVNVPHDYSIEGPPGKDSSTMDGPFDKSSPAGPGGGFLNGGIGWYRKTFQRQRRRKDDAFPLCSTACT